jgi:hypothetical protein
MNSVFSAPPEDARRVLDSYDACIASAMPLSPRRERLLPRSIFSLSHNLTDGRGGRRLGYLNDPASVTAYVWYYHWWNLERLSRLFAALPAEIFDVPEDGVCADIGSGPLTAVGAAYLSRPELRAKNLTWYCVDRSKAIMEKGEDLFFALRSALLKQAGPEAEAGEWKIVRVHGDAGAFSHKGVRLRKKARLVIASNVYNEILEQHEIPVDTFAARAASRLASYCEAGASLVVVEPGVPRSARFISLLRGRLTASGAKEPMPARILSPCPHPAACPMAGERGGKWCHFAFSSDGAPKKLAALSEAAAMPKEKASLSFIAAKFSGAETENPKGKKIPVRIASDPIKLPGGRIGFYGCSELGLTLVETPVGGKTPRSGDIVEAERPRVPERDKKSGAVIVRPSGKRPKDIR